MRPDKDGTPGVKALEKRLHFMRGQQERIVPVWKEISKYIAPNRGSYDWEEPNQGRRRDRHLADASPARALEILQSGMQGGFTSPSRAWFKLAVADPRLAAIQSVMEWTDDVTERIIDALGRSNIYNCFHGLYGELGAFGIGALFIEEDGEDVIHGKLMTAGEYFVEYDSRGKPSAFGRILWMTAGQMRERFGEERLSDNVRAALNQGRHGAWFKVCHLICEDDARETRFPFIGVYWEEGKELELGLGGYEEFPVMAPRWETVASDFYGYGPGWLALGESKTLQAMREDYMIAQKMAINPPVVGPDMGRNARYDTRPGAVNHTTDPNAKYGPLFTVSPDIPGQLAAMEGSRQLLNQIFYADLFLMIAGLDNRDMTAREVQIRLEEKFQMLGPVIERLEHELLDPAISRVFNIMNRAGMFPPPPEELEGREVKLEYVSMLALAQKSGSLGDLSNMTAMIAGLAGLDPGVVDKLKADEIVDQYVRMTNIPAAVIRSDDEVAAMRQARAQQQQQEQEMMAAREMAGIARDGAGAAKDLAAAPVQQGSVMDAMFNGGGGEA
jgi:hypothetical protein